MRGRLQVSTQNRVKLLGFTPAAQEWLRESPLRVVRAGETVVIERVPEGLSLGRDGSLFIPNGQDTLEGTHHYTFTWAIVHDSMFLKLGERKPISPELASYCKLRADKALTDPNQQRLFDELSPKKRKKE